MLIVVFFFSRFTRDVDMPTPCIMAGIERARSQWGWIVALGVLLLIVGAAAISANALTTLVTILFLGWMLIFTGAFELLSAFRVREWGGFFLHLLCASLDLVLGYLFLAEPVKGAMVLTVFLACILFVGGAFRIVASLSTRCPGWIWGLLSGAINVVLGVLLLKQWPYDGLWFIGFCVGLELIFRGWFWIMLGFGLKRSADAT
jgi:uncharacterized membrane protein HdeD (DUF308 family)